jgi:hypothetical protein
MNEREQEIFYRLLIDLFVDNPKKKQRQMLERSGTNEKFSTEQTSTEPKRQPAKTTHK